MWKKQLLTFPRWEPFLGVVCASGWGNVKTFSKCASDWGNSKKVKNVKNGGTMFVYRCLMCTNMAPPMLKNFKFFRISPVSSTCSKKFLTFAQPEAHSIFLRLFPSQKHIPFFIFNISPARSTPRDTIFLTFPQPEAHPKMQFLTFPQAEADFQKKLKISPTTGFLSRS